MYYARNRKNRFNLLRLMEMEGQRFIVLDLETTGLDAAKDYVAEFSLMECRVHDGGIERENGYDWYLRPPVRMNRKAAEITGIDDAFLSDKPTEDEMFPQIVQAVGENPIIIGHNISFDIGMMKAMYARHGMEFGYTVSMDTMDFARDNLPPDVMRKRAKNEGLDENRMYRLSSLTSYYGVDEGLRPHCGIDDVEGTVRLVEVMRDEYLARPPAGSERIQVKYFYFWEGRNKAQRGIWARLADGRLIYFSTLYKTWASSQVNLSEIDIDYIEDYIMKRCGVSLATLGKMTGKRWDALKQKRREEGVYI